MKKHILPLVFISLLLSACTSVQVRPLDKAHHITHVGIKNNPKVTVPSFLSVVRNGFDDHGISSTVFNGPVPDNCQYVLTYTALRSWDFATYLSHAELRLEDREGRRLASAQYHLKGKGGLSLMKWGSVESKMKPVIDELLYAYRAGNLGSDTYDKLSSDHIHADFEYVNQDHGQGRDECLNKNPDIDENILRCIKSGTVIEGMTREQIVAAIGTPEGVIKNINGTFLIYYRNNKQVTYPLENNVYVIRRAKIYKETKPTPPPRETIQKL